MQLVFGIYCLVQVYKFDDVNAKDVKDGKFEAIAWNPWKPDEGSETRGKRFEIEQLDE